MSRLKATAPSPLPSSSGCTAGLIEVGVRPALRTLLATAHDEDAMVSLHRVLPKTDDWVLRGDPPSRHATVTWKGGQAWPDIAYKIALDAQLCLTLDWARHTVTMARTSGATAVIESPPAVLAVSAPVKPPAQGAESPRLPPGAHGTPERAVSAETLAAPLPAPSTPVLFALKAGDTVRSTLDRWCRTAGWTLVWSAPLDYPVDVSTTLPIGTEFRGAVKEVLRAYWSQPYALEGHTYSNQVLEIVGREK